VARAGLGRRGGGDSGRRNGGKNHNFKEQRGRRKKTETNKGASISKKKKNPPGGVCDSKTDEVRGAEGGNSRLLINSVLSPRRKEGRGESGSKFCGI